LRNKILHYTIIAISDQVFQRYPYLELIIAKQKFIY